MGKKTDKDQDVTQDDVDDVVQDDELEKALDYAIEALNKGKGGGYEEEDEEDEEDEDSAEDEDEDRQEELRKKKMKKSRKKAGETLAKSIQEIAEEDDDLSEDDLETFDVVPVLKSLASAMDKQTESVLVFMNEIESRMLAIEGMLTKSVPLSTAQAKMIKSMRQEVKAIGDQTNRRKSVIAEGITPMRKSFDIGSGKKPSKMTGMQIMDKAEELKKSGKINMVQLTTIESFVNQGAGVPENLQHLFTESE